MHHPLAVPTARHGGGLGWRGAGQPEKRIQNEWPATRPLVVPDRSRANAVGQSKRTCVRSPMATFCSDRRPVYCQCTHTIQYNTSRPARINICSSVGRFPTQGHRDILSLRAAKVDDGQALDREVGSFSTRVGRSLDRYLAASEERFMAPSPFRLLLLLPLLIHTEDGEDDPIIPCKTR